MRFSCVSKYYQLACKYVSWILFMVKENTPIDCKYANTLIGFDYEIDLFGRIHFD